MIDVGEFLMNGISADYIGADTAKILLISAAGAGNFGWSGRTIKLLNLHLGINVKFSLDFDYYKHFAA